MCFLKKYPPGEVKEKEKFGQALQKSFHCNSFIDTAETIEFPFKDAIQQARKFYGYAFCSCFVCVNCAIMTGCVQKLLV